MNSYRGRTTSGSLFKCGREPEKSLPYYASDKAIFIVALVLFLQMKAGRDPTMAKFEVGQEVRPILTKGGLRLQSFWS